MSTRQASALLWSRVWAAVALAAFAGLCVYVLTRTKPPFYDEPAHFAQVRALTTSTSFRAWLLANDTSAPGPVHALMHYALSRGHGVMAVPWCRLPNLVLLAAVLALTALHLGRVRATHPWSVALAGMAVPMTWVMAGMALTEMPAMLGITAAAYAALRLGEPTSPSSRAGWVWAAVLAVGVALAVCGRQTYLVTLPALMLLAAGNWRSFYWAAAGVAAGLVPAGWLFAIWGGLVPPKMHFLDASLQPEHGLIALGYAGLTALLLAPGFFLTHWRKTLPVGIAALGLNAITHTVHFTTLTSVQSLLGHHALGRVMEWTASQSFVIAGTVFVFTIGLEWWTRRERWFAAHACGVLALCLVCIGVAHLFSSRYTGMTLPFLLPMLSRWINFSKWTVLRLLVPLGAGAAMLHSYYVLA